MRTDHKNIIVGRARRGDKTNYARRLRRQTSVVVKNEDGEYDLANHHHRLSLEGRVKMRAYKYWNGDSRSFSDHIAPLFRLIERAVDKGETWSALYSRFCEYADRRSLLGWHIRGHFHNLFVNVQFRKDGKLCVNPKYTGVYCPVEEYVAAYQFYVDPRTDLVHRFTRPSHHWPYGKSKEEIVDWRKELIRKHRREVVFLKGAMYIHFKDQWFEAFGKRYDKSALYFFKEALRHLAEKDIERMKGNPFEEPLVKDAFGLKLVTRRYGFLPRTSKDVTLVWPDEVLHIYGAYVILTNRRALSKQEVKNLGLDLHQFQMIERWETL